MSVLKLDNVTKKFGSFRALEDVSLNLKQGEVHGFIGPNGAGKSTTIRVILGILKATKGGATVFGMDAWNDRVAIHRRISYVPGDVNLWPNLSGGEVIDLFMKLQGSGCNQKRDALIEKFQLDPTKKCRTYSKGNRQKVALIAAFATEADLYIFDEPTSGLDPLMEKVFHECVMEVKAQGKTVLLSSHILTEVEKLCDSISIIRNGEIVESGDLAELRKQSRMEIRVQTDADLAGIAEQPGVHQVETSDGLVKFELENQHTSEIVSYLAQFQIDNLEMSQMPLENLFMRHYDTEGDARGKNQ